MEMNRPSFSPQITDETLSAYLDGVVTAEERSLIDRALAQDAELSWRLESLRQTVYFLSTLPAVKTRRSFSLEAILAAEAAAEGQRVGAHTLQANKVRKQTQPDARSHGTSGWQRFLDFWNGGSLALRNGAMVAAALLLVVTVSTQAVPAGTTMAPQQATMSEMAAAAPGESAVESVALLSENSPQSDEAVAKSADTPVSAAVAAEEAPAAEVNASAETSTESESPAPAAQAMDASAATAAVPELNVAAASTSSPDVAMAAPVAPDLPAGAGGIGSAANSLGSPAMSDPAMGDPALGGMGGGNGALGGAMPPQFAPESAIQGGGPAATGLDQVQAEALGDSSALRETSPAAQPAAPAASESAVAAAEILTTDEAVAEDATTNEAAEEVAGEDTAAASSAMEAAAAVAPVPAEAVLAYTDAESANAQTADAQVASADTQAVEITTSEESLTVSSDEVAVPGDGVSAAEAVPAGDTTQNATLVTGSITANTAGNIVLATSAPWLLYAEIALAVVTLLLTLLWLRSRQRST